VDHPVVLYVYAWTRCRCACNGPREGVVWLSRFTTRFGSLDDHEKGRVEVIDDEPHHYACSNVLLVWENADADLPELISSGKLPNYPVEL
jgi:hypothetical protein